MVALFLSALAIWLFVRAAATKPAWSRSLLGTVALGAAFATHSHAIVAGAALMVWLAWREIKEGGQRRSLLVLVTLIVAWVPLFVWKTRAQGETLDRHYLHAFDVGQLYRLLFVWFPHGSAIRPPTLAREWTRVWTGQRGASGGGG
jgi:hypothetical protein